MAFLGDDVALYLLRDALSDVLHAFGSELKLWQCKVQIALCAQWNQVNVRVGNFKS